MRIALITGASSGLGREYARWASDHGDYDQIWAVARRRERLEKLASELSTPVRLVPLDLTEKSSITQLKGLLDEAAVQDTARGEKFSVGLLVNAAGLGKFGTYADMTCEEVDTMVDLNCRALVDVTAGGACAHGARRAHHPDCVQRLVPAAAGAQRVCGEQGVCPQLHAGTPL